jgi:hypothetical protein
VAVRTGQIRNRCEEKRTEHTEKIPGMAHQNAYGHAFVAVSFLAIVAARSHCHLAGQKCAPDGVDPSTPSLEAVKLHEYASSATCWGTDGLGQECEEARCRRNMCGQDGHASIRYPRGLNNLVLGLAEAGGDEAVSGSGHRIYYVEVAVGPSAVTGCSQSSDFFHPFSCMLVS